MIVSTQKLAKTLIPAVLFASECHHVIGIDDIRTGQAPDDRQFHHWADLVAGDADVARARAAHGAGRPRATSPASSTPAAPAARRAACMQHHGAILHNVEACTDVIANDFGWDDEIFLSFLPASHAYEHTGGQHFPIGLGAQIYYAESLEKLAANIEEVRPTIMVVVPRLFEMLRARILKRSRRAAALSNYLLNRALSIGTQRYDGKSVPWDLPMDGSCR